jgi:hypothetical protein
MICGYVIIFEANTTYIKLKLHLNSCNPIKKHYIACANLHNIHKLKVKNEVKNY